MAPTDVRIRCLRDPFPVGKSGDCGILHHFTWPDTQGKSQSPNPSPLITFG